MELKIIDRLAFKLKSSKILFCIGLLIAVFIAAIAVFRDKKNQEMSIFKESASLITDNGIRFAVVIFVLIVNLYYAAKLVEGVIQRLPYKILPWILINTVNLVQATIYFFKLDDLIGYMTLLVIVFIWMVIVVVFIEVRRASRDETIECTSQATNISYDNFPRDKTED